MVREIEKTLKPTPPKIKNVHFRPDKDYIDFVAQKSIPLYGPQDFDAIKIATDGNCMCRALSHGSFRTDAMHLQICACIVIEGILRKEHYISHQCLVRGANYVRTDEELPVVYVRYLDHYANGQKITDNTIDYMYYRELHDCCKVGSYMGLWQIAQAASVLKVPIHSVYPEGRDTIMRHDFNRWFFPVKCDVQNTTDSITLVWTSMTANTLPAHFVPLLPKQNQVRD